MGLNRDSGLFALAGVVPQPPELSYDTGDSLVLKGAAAGGSVLGAYTFASADRAGLVHVRWELNSGVKEEYQLQVPPTVTARRPWLPVSLVYEADASYTDDAGGSGPCSLHSGEDYLLGASGWLYIADPTPGARMLTITVSTAGEEISFTAALAEEVPPL